MTGIKKIADFYIFMQIIFKSIRNMIFIRLSKKYTNGFCLNGNRCTVIFLSYLGVVRSSIYIHKFLRILTSGAKSGARSSRDAESAARMANRFLKKRATFPSRIMMIKFSEIYVNVCRQLQVNFATSKRKKIQINAKKIL